MVCNIILGKIAISVGLANRCSNGTLRGAFVYNLHMV